MLEPSYTPDYAAEIDKPEEIIADDMGITIKQARMVIAHTDNACKTLQALTLARIIGLLLSAKNMPVMTHAIAFAAGLDQLNGAKSQSEVARELGCTRALMSHYVVGVRDVLSGKQDTFDNLSFRKSNEARLKYAVKASSKLITMKREIRKRMKDQKP